jgi:hypothetical protein
VNAREDLEKWLSKRHPCDVKQRLDAYHDEVRRETLELIRSEEGREQLMREVTEASDLLAYMNEVD